MNVRGGSRRIRIQRLLAAATLTVTFGGGGPEMADAFDYAERIGGLPDERRLHFYEVLAHQLTVVARMIWSDQGLTDAQKLSQLKWLNEVLHRVTAKVYTLRLRTHEWTEADSFDDIRHRVSQEAGLAPRVGWAIRLSYEIVAASPEGGHDEYQGLKL